MIIVAPPSDIRIVGSRTFACINGHKQDTITPFEIYLSGNLRSGPVCPVCIFEFISKNFSVSEIPEPKTP